MENSFWTGVLIGLIMTAFALVAIVPEISISKKVIIEQGHAEYNKTTGEWQWKECRHEQAN